MRIYQFHYTCERKIELLFWQEADLGLNSNVSATGTVQDALTKMAMFDPVSAAAINASVLSNTTSAALDQSVGPNEDYVATTRFCNNMPGGLASSLRIKQGIQYLGTVSGTPTEGPGPGNCGRVSCSYGGAIYWCNDVSTAIFTHQHSDVSNETDCLLFYQNLDTKILSSYLNIADGAQLVVDYCENTYVGGVNGQQFYEDGWNVIVRYENC